MAKTKLREGFRQYRVGNRPGKVARSIPAKITIDRDSKHFVACIRIGTQGYRTIRDAYHFPVTKPGMAMCASGSNPRKALAEAFAVAAKNMKWRGEYGHGAFAGLRRRR